MDNAVWYPLARRAVCAPLHSLRPTTSPNEITAASCVFKVLTLFAVLRGHVIATLVCSLLAYILDCADGLWARESGQQSEFGAWFDHTSDLVYGVAVGLLLLFITPPWPMLALLCVLLYASFTQRGCRSLTNYTAAVHACAPSLDDATAFPPHTFCVSTRFPNVVDEGVMNFYLIFLLLAACRIRSVM